MQRQYRYWRKHPPLHLMVAQYLGIKPAEETEVSELPAGSYEKAKEAVADLFQGDPSRWFQ